MRISDWSSDVCAADLPVVDYPFVVCDRVLRLAVHADDCLGLHGPCSKVARLSGWSELPAVDSWQSCRPRQRWGWWARPGAGVAPRLSFRLMPIMSIQQKQAATSTSPSTPFLSTPPAYPPLRLPSTADCT